MNDNSVGSSYYHSLNVRAQRRFSHLVRKDPGTGAVTPRPGREADIEKLRCWVQSNVERLYSLAQLT